MDRAETEAKLVSIWNEEFPEDKISSIDELDELQIHENSEAGRGQNE